MRKALVVGIDSYPNCSLKGCINDANSVARILERNGDGSANFSVRTYIDVKTKGDLRGYIEDCFLGDSDIALFYFSGHGYIDDIGGYIVTPDYTEHDMGVSMQDILAIISNSKCKNKIVILDCCHAGFLGRINIYGQSSSIIHEGVTLLTASKSDEPSVELGNHGLFTALLLEALSGGAADISGFITPGSIYAYIDKALGPWDQRPVFKTNVTRFSPLRKVSPQVDDYVLRKITDYFLEPNTELVLNPSFEPTNDPNVQHDIIQPYADIENVSAFSDLQKLAGVGLVVPCGEEHMYYAAMKSKSCKLTPIGQHYWCLIKKNFI